MVITLISQNQSQPMSEVLEMDGYSRSKLDEAGITRRQFIAERVLRHRVKMMDVSKRYFGLGLVSGHEEAAILASQKKPFCLTAPVINLTSRSSSS
jgi:hypothetical protein